MSDDERTQETTEMPSDPPTEEAPARSGAKRFLRSRDDRVIAGVSGGLGRYFDIDPVIVRIAFAITILFGGLGVVAYVAAVLFVPSDDGAGQPAPSSRGRGIARVVGVGLLLLVGIGGFGALVAGAALVTGLGYGGVVVAAIVLIGLALVVLSFQGGARWLIVPALALTIGVGAAAAADLDLDGGIGRRDYRPLSATAIPAGGYELGVGRMSVDLRDIDWSPTRVLDLDVRIGAGELVIAVPSDVCVTGEAHADGGDLQIAGDQADGIDVGGITGGGSRAEPRLVLHADVGYGQLRVLNDDDVDIVDNFGDRFHHSFNGSSQIYREANAKACAG